MKISRSSWIVVWGMTVTPTYGGKPFSYLPQSEIVDDSAYGLEDWDKVEPSEYFVDWTRFYRRPITTNQCQWKPDSGGHQQSPIDLGDWGKCDKEKDDKHRLVTKHGDCEWEKLIWSIKPYGLELTLPMPNNKDANPEENPCKKPKFDSSGGYGSEFFMAWMNMKTPSEHTWEGKRYDAEIQMGFFRYRGNDPSIYGGPPYTVHILVNAGAIEEDNPILQPYLDEWEKVSDATLSNCISKFGYDPALDLQSMAPTQSFAPTISPAPTMAPTIVKSCVQERELDLLTGIATGDGRSSRMSGIMFDVQSVRKDGSLQITELDINIRSTRFEEVEIWTRVGSWQEDDPQGSRNKWLRVFADSTRGKGPGDPTKITLETPIDMIPGSTQAFYIVHIDDNDLFNIVYPQNATGTELASDDNLMVLVGQAIDENPFQASRARDFKMGRGFNGIIHYTECTGGRHGSQRNLREKKTTTQRELDHDFIDNWNDRREKKPIEFSTKKLPWDPFRLFTSPWYVRYRGSFTMPQCFDETRVRILDRPLQISARQLTQIENMISSMRDPSTCKLGTAGRPRGDTGYVDVNRPLQQRNSEHNLKYCDDGDFGHADFWYTPRGNTCWCLLNGNCPDGCDIDCAGNCEGPACDSHWHPNDPTWTAKRCPDRD